MRCLSAALITAILISMMLSSTALAHVPVFPEGNGNLSDATPISDPTKSWAIYGTLEPDKAQYFSFEIDRGEKIYLSLLTSTSLDDVGFSPSFALIGPGLKTEGDLPGFVEVPQGYGAIALAGNRSQEATYEPFGPSSYYSLAELNISAPESGRYYAAVYDIERGGNYSLAVGYRETSTIQERIFLPLALISVYEWSGESIDFVLAPLALVLVFGFYRVWKSGRRFSLFSIASEAAALLFFGWGATILVQIIYNSVRAPVGSGIMISLALVVIPFVLGLVAAIASRSVVSSEVRVAMAIIGAIGLALGSGFILGPVLAIASSALPSKKH